MLRIALQPCCAISIQIVLKLAQVGDFPCQWVVNLWRLSRVCNFSVFF
jgi:hypothetical protein